MLRAISGLKAVDAPIAVATAAPAAPRPLDTAERRQVTVMFSDLVGSTALSARMDPEDLREVISAYQNCVAETVQRFGGFVAKYMGDGVLVYFGYPQAHEDDAELAVRAGLALIEAVGKLSSVEPIQVRIGVGTGVVVVGDLIGSGEAQERGVVGETPNLAARLQAGATPGTIAIDPTTRRLLGGLFEFRDLGGIEAKGFANRVQAYEVVRPSMVESRFEALRTATTPLVGRGEEIDLLLRRWEQAKRGDGCVVLISGEPGIGKSRLTETIVERLGGEPHKRLRYFCSPHHGDSALYPSIAQLERAAGFRREDTAEQRLAKLEAILAQGTNDLNEAVPLLADLLSIPTGDRYPPLNLTPQKRKEKTLLAQLAQLEGLAARQPVLIVWEDVHWSDPTTRESLDLLIDRAPSLRVLMILTFRPEFTAPWTGRPHVTMLTLNRLPRRHRAEMIAYVTGGKALPKAIADQIVDRTDGVPLFIEELTKTVIESGIVTEAGDHYAVAGPIAPLAIPTSLHASLLARLDRLAPTREVAQIGAALGRSFSYKLISAVAGMPQQKLDGALEQLASAELIFRRGVPPDAEYTFKHALVQDAAYATLLRARRRQLHQAIAAALEREFPETAATQPELLAHHCTEASLAEQAVQYWRRAGERALARSANLEAIAHLTRGIQLLDSLPQGRQRDEQELMFQASLVAPLWTNCGFGSPEAERASRRALELCQRAAPDTPAHFRALYGLAYAYLIRGDLRRARPLAEQLLDLAGRLQDPELLAYAHFEMGCELLWSAELVAARAHLEQGIALYDPEWGRPASSRHAFNCASNCHAFLTRVCWHLSYPEHAMRHRGQAIAIAEDISHPFSQAVALGWTAALHQLRGETRRTQELAETLLAFATEQVFPFFAAHSMVFRGWALVEHGQSEEGIAQLREGLIAYRATGAELESSHWLGLLAEVCRHTGKAEEGLRVVAEAFDHIAQSGIVYYEPELQRLEGELRLCHDPADAQKAEACFRRALAVARQQQAKSWELRAVMSLARLWRDQGKPQQARELLAPVYGWFTEGFDTRDLKEAKALLDELAS
jgi:class 3 adenylate cyclase/predicted ATPase